MILQCVACRGEGSARLCCVALRPALPSGRSFLAEPGRLQGLCSPPGDGGLTFISPIICGFFFEICLLLERQKAGPSGEGAGGKGPGGGFAEREVSSFRWI